MSDKFNGFSQDEINRVSGQKNKKLPIDNGIKPATFRGHGGIRRMPDKSEINRLQKMQGNMAANKKNLADKIQQMDTNDSMEEINLDSSLSKSIEEALFYKPPEKSQQQSNETTTTTSKTPATNTMARTPTLTTSRPSIAAGQPYTHKELDSQQQQQQTSNTSSILKLNLEDESKISSTCSNSMDDDESILPSAADEKTNDAFVPPSSLNVQSPFRGISLKDFETHRKMIEEQNRQKKDLLYKVIEQHSQKTAAEARKIAEIKAELSKLDNDLAVDVAVLRKQIEAACIHFSNIEKNYLKIEAQFLKAKMDLHNASEKKELLTEHLCTVIAHNEDRKAQKLTELMEKVGLSSPNNGDYEPPSSTSK